MAVLFLTDMVAGAHGSTAKGTERTPCVNQRVRVFIESHGLRAGESKRQGGCGIIIRFDVMHDDDQAIILTVVTQLKATGAKLIRGRFLGDNAAFLLTVTSRVEPKALDDINQEFTKLADLFLLHPGDNCSAIDDRHDPEAACTGLTNRFRAYILNVECFNLVGAVVHAFPFPIQLAVTHQLLVNPKTQQ